MNPTRSGQRGPDGSEGKVEDILPLAFGQSSTPELVTVIV